MKTIFPLSVLAFAIAASPSPRKPPSRPRPPLAKDRNQPPATAPNRIATQAAPSCPTSPPRSPRFPLACPAPNRSTPSPSPPRQTQRHLSHGRPQPARCPRHSVARDHHPQLRRHQSRQRGPHRPAQVVHHQIHRLPRRWHRVRLLRQAPRAAPLIFQQGPNAQGQRQVVTGMDTGLDGMRVGGKRRLFIPWQLAYGPNPYKTIPPKSELIFDIELVSQSDIDPRTLPVSSTPVRLPQPNRLPHRLRHHRANSSRVPSSGRRGA